MKTKANSGMMVLVLALVAGLASRGWADSGMWTVDGNGNWNVNGNWTGASYPDGVGQTAAITNNISAAIVVTLNTPVTLGTLLAQDRATTTYAITVTNATANDKITLDNGVSPAVVSDPFALSADTIGRYIYPDLILKSDLNVAVRAYGGFNLYGAISEQGGVRNVTLDNTYSTGVGPRLYGTNSSYTGKTTVKRYANYFASIGNVGGGNSALGAPVTVENGTIEIGDGANAVVFTCTASTAMRTDRILKFVGTTGSLGLGGGAGNQVTYTTPFQFSGIGAKFLRVYGVVVNGGMDKSDLTVECGIAGSGARDSALLGLNTYTNGTSIYRSTLTINSLSSVASPVPSSLGAPTTVANGTITMGDGTTATGLKYIGTGHSSDRVIHMAAATTGGVTLDASGYGRFTLTSALTTAVGSGAKTVTLTGTGEGELQGAIPDGSGGATALSKTGAGAWTLEADNSSGLTGTITINGAGGTLKVGHDNALNTGAMTLTAGNLAASGAARTLNNTITAISSGFGFTGSEDLTLTATIPATAGARTLYNRIASGKTLTLGAINMADGSARTTTFEGSGDTVIGGIIANGGAGAGSLTMSGTGTLTLKGANTYTGATALNAGGTLVLDYTSQDNSKLDDSAALTLGGANMGGAITLSNSAANHIEQVGSTALGAGGIRVIRPSGGATLRLQALARSAGGTIDFGADSIADVSLANVNSILGGWATVGGTNWAVGGAGNTPVTAFTGYTTPFPAAGPGAAANNYFHNVAGQAQSAVAANTLKIANGQNSDTLTLNGNLTNTSTSATSLGGILYVGGYDNIYTIGGTGRILPSTAAQELIFNVYTGTLTVSAPIHAAAAAAGSLTKSGAGRLAVSNANAFTGATRVNEGILKLQNSTALGTSSGVSVQRSAAVELEGGVTLARTLTLFGAGPDGSGALKNVSGANTCSGAITIGTGGARIENADTGNALTLSGGIMTASGKDLALGGAGSIVVSTAAIAGAGAITKEGTGTNEWSAVNTATGPVAVNAGTLKVTGSIANGSKVTVNSGGTLSGSGTCYGEVWVKSGGTIRPEGGNLTVSNLVLFGGCTNVFNVGGAGSNIVVSAFGEMILQRGLTIAADSGNKVEVWANGTVLPNSTNNLIAYSGDLNGSVANLEMANDPSPGSPYSFIATNGYIALVAGASYTAPTIQPDQASISTNMLEDGGTLDLTGLGLYATDPDGTSWTWTNTSSAMNGTVSVNGTGTNPVSWTSFSYTPAANFNGTNSFVVRVKDNTDQSDSITVTVAVAAVNDAPTNTVTPGYDLATTFITGTVWTVTNGVWNDSADTNANYDGTGLTFAYQWYCSNSPSATPISGATSAGYTPGAEWLGSNLCAAVSCIDVGDPGSATGTVYTAWREVLGAANTPPVIQIGGTPVDSVTTNISEDAGAVTLTGFGFTATDDGVGGAGVTWTNAAQPDNGTVAVSGSGTNPVTWASFTYTPNANFNGTNTFVVEVRDAIGAAGAVTVTVVVAAINDAPVNTVPPTYTGTRLIGNNLTVSSTGTWNDNADTNAGYTAGNFSSTAVYTYQWQRATNFAGDGLVNIPNATNTTYTLVFDDKYKYLRLAVTCTDSGAPGSASTTAYSTPWQQEQSVAPVAVTFNKTSDVWTNYLNWTPNDVPLSGIDAKIGDPAVCSPATALLSGGDNAAKGLFIANNANGVGTLNMTGGVLAVGSSSIKVAGGASSTGTLNQTAGSITCATFSPLAAGAGSVGSVTLGGTSYIQWGLTVASGTGASGTLTFTGNARNYNGSGAYQTPTLIGSGTNATGRLNVYENASFDGAAPATTDLQLGVGPGSTGILVVAGQAVVSNVVVIVGVAGAGIVTIADTGRVSCTLYVDGTNAPARVTVADDGLLSSGGSYYIGYNPGAFATVVLTNNGVLWGWTSGNNPTYIGYGANAYGRIELYDKGTLNSKRNNGNDNQLLLGYGVGSTGIVTMTGNAVITNVSTFTVGEQGYGSLSMDGNSSLRVSGVATLGNAAGAEGVMEVTGGSWSQAGALNIGTVAGATGRLTVADCALTGLAGATTIGGGVTVGDRQGMVVISNATFGIGAAVTVRTNGFVELTGTGSVFQCNTFTCRGGAITNHVRKTSGGMDITNTAATALVVTNGGTMRLLFEQTTEEGGVLWGLRWAGNSHSNAIAVMVGAGALSWDDSAMGVSAGIFTNATHTMVGYLSAPVARGTVFRFR